jgi:MoaA/NifB/PqqE/SkfB family radical SAM enzyme
MLKDILKITFEITNRCSLRCRICHIWKERPTRDLALEDIHRVLDLCPSVRAISLTGGEPLLHPGIHKIYRGLFKLYIKRKIHAIDIATNAYDPRTLLFFIRQKKFLKPLSLAVSIDGTPQNHDAQRGIPGAFAQTLRHVRALRKYHIPVTIKFTVSRLNYTDLFFVENLARTLGCDFHFKTAEELSSYYHRQKTGRPPLLTPRSRQEFRRMLDKLSIPRDRRYDIHRLALRHHKQFLDKGDLSSICSCLTPKKSLFVTSAGIIYNCLYQKPIGTIDALLRISETQAQKNISMGKKGQCPRCLAYHGFLRDFNLKIRNAD